MKKATKKSRPTFHRKRTLQFRTGTMESVLQDEPDNSFTAALTDPPYDTIAKHTELEWNRSVSAEQWAEVHRVLMPGAYCVAFGSPARHHRMMTAMEDAGFEIKDVFLWLFGDRMPKARDIGKKMGDDRWHDYHPFFKQAWEPIVIAQKPANLPYHETARLLGIGGLNVGACRIKMRAGEVKGGYRDASSRKNMFKPYKYVPPVQDGTRYPPNVILDEYFASQLDEQTLTDGADRVDNPHTYFFQRMVHCSQHPPSLGNDSSGKWTKRGPVSRFFYCPKASPAERSTYNTHSCVKPRALLRWLLAMLMYPGKNRILDPFVGSGSTALAARTLQIDLNDLELSGLFIDYDPKSIQIAKRRMRDLAYDPAKLPSYEGSRPGRRRRARGKTTGSAVVA